MVRPMPVDDHRRTNTGTGWVAGSVDGSPVTRLNVLPCFQHSSLLLVAAHLALAERHVGVAAVSPMAYTSSPMRTTATARAVDIEPGRAARGQVGEGADRRRHAASMHDPPEQLLGDARRAARRRSEPDRQLRRARRRRSRARPGARPPPAGCRGSRGRSAARRRSGRPCWRGCTSRRWSGCRGWARSRPTRPR